MKCQASGRIITELPTVHGSTKNGNDFEKREYTIEEDDQYHYMIQFCVWLDDTVDKPTKDRR